MKRILLILLPLFATASILHAQHGKAQTHLERLLAALLRRESPTAYTLRRNIPAPTGQEPYALVCCPFVLEDGKAFEDDVQKAFRKDLGNRLLSLYELRRASDRTSEGLVWSVAYSSQAEALYIGSDFSRNVALQRYPSALIEGGNRIVAADWHLKADGRCEGTIYLIDCLPGLHPLQPALPAAPHAPGDTLAALDSDYATKATYCASKFTGENSPYNLAIVLKMGEIVQEMTERRVSDRAVLAYVRDLLGRMAGVCSQTPHHQNYLVRLMVKMDHYLNTLPPPATPRP